MVYNPVKKEEGTMTAVGMERNLTGSIKLNQVQTVEGTGSYTKVLAFFFLWAKEFFKDFKDESHDLDLFIP